MAPALPAGPLGRAEVEQTHIGGGTWRESRASAVLQSHLRPNNQLVGHEGGGCQLIVLMVATAGHGPGEQRGKVKLPSPCLKMPSPFSRKQTTRATASLKNSFEVVQLVELFERSNRNSQHACLKNLTYINKIDRKIDR